MLSIGIDEVGRGTWAGPLLVAAVVKITTTDTTPHFPDKTRDSKKLSPIDRELVSKVLKSQFIYKLAWANVQEIDELGLTKTTARCIKKVIEDSLATVEQKLTETYNQSSQIPTTDLQIRIDGHNILEGYYPKLPLWVNPTYTFVVRGEDAYQEIAAASIIAKVERDKYMCDLAKKYPAYGFELHKGYGTKFHLGSLQKNGPIKGIHRFSFDPIKKLINT